MTTRGGSGEPADALPVATGDRYRLALVCLGNICRSPMAAVVLEQRLGSVGLGDRVEVTSAGTGDWHRGEPMDPRAAATLTTAGYDPTRHRARHFDESWWDRDLILVMDHRNRADVLAAGARPEQVRLFRSFDPDAEVDAEVPDPWYDSADGFEQVLAIVERTTTTLLARLRDVVAAEGRPERPQ